MLVAVVQRTPRSPTVVTGVISPCSHLLFIDQDLRLMAHQVLRLGIVYQKFFFSTATRQNIVGIYIFSHVSCNLERRWSSTVLSIKRNRVS